MVVGQYRPTIPTDIPVKQAQLHSVNDSLPADGLPAESENGLSTQHDTLRPRILLLDTDREFVRQFTSLVRDLGYVVTVSNSAAEAHAFLQEPNAFDLLVVDPRASIAGEIDLIRHVTERLPDIPLMAVTDAADIQSAIEVLKLGAVDYLIKPIRSAILNESLRTIFDKTLPFMEI